MSHLRQFLFAPAQNTTACDAAGCSLWAQQDSNLRPSAFLFGFGKAQIRAIYRHPLYLITQ